MGKKLIFCISEVGVRGQAQDQRSSLMVSIKAFVPAPPAPKCSPLAFWPTDLFSHRKQKKQEGVILEFLCDGGDLLHSVLMCSEVALECLVLPEQHPNIGQRGPLIVLQSQELIVTYDKHTHNTHTRLRCCIF